MKDKELIKKIRNENLELEETNRLLKEKLSIIEIILKEKLGSVNILMELPGLWKGQKTSCKSNITTICLHDYIKNNPPQNG
jgi:hypothetical protein